MLTFDDLYRTWDIRDNVRLGGTRTSSVGPAATCGASRRSRGSHVVVEVSVRRYRNRQCNQDDDHAGQEERHAADNQMSLRYARHVEPFPAARAGRRRRPIQPERVRSSKSTAVDVSRHEGSEQPVLCGRARPSERRGHVLGTVTLRLSAPLPENATPEPHRVPALRGPIRSISAALTERSGLIPMRSAKMLSEQWPPSLSRRDSMSSGTTTSGGARGVRPVTLLNPARRPCHDVGKPPHHQRPVAAFFPP